MDLFETRGVKAMLIGREEEAFDSPEYLYELKLDGDRCLAYLDPQKGTNLINRKGRNMLPYVPELQEMHLRVKERCILDGELIIGSGGKRDFELLRSRLTTTNQYRLKRLAREAPASFVAFDLVYLGRESLIQRPLIERKQLLERNVEEDSGLVVTRYIEERGVDFYRLVVEQGLEGIVAKRKDSRYLMGKRSPDWVKFKNWTDDDFVICGYYPSDRANVVSLVLGQYRERPDASPELVYKGHVVLGRSNEDFAVVERQPHHEAGQTVKWGATPDEHPKTIWLQPLLVCTIEFVGLTSGGGLRQPIYRGLRNDKDPRDCIEKSPDGDSA